MWIYPLYAPPMAKTTSVVTSHCEGTSRKRGGSLKGSSAFNRIYLSLPPFFRTLFHILHIHQPKFLLVPLSKFEFNVYVGSPIQSWGYCNVSSSRPRLSYSRCLSSRHPLSIGRNRHVMRWFADVDADMCAVLRSHHCRHLLLSISSLITVLVYPNQSLTFNKWFLILRPTASPSFPLCSNCIAKVNTRPQPHRTCEMRDNRTTILGHRLRCQDRFGWRGQVRCEKSTNVGSRFEADSEGRLGSENSYGVALLFWRLSKTDNTSRRLFLRVEDVDRFRDTRAVWKSSK